MGRGKGFAHAAPLVVLMGLQKTVIMRDSKTPHGRTQMEGTEYSGGLQELIKYFLRGAGTGPVFMSVLVLLVLMSCLSTFPSSPIYEVHVSVQTRHRRRCRQGIATNSGRLRVITLLNFCWPKPRNARSPIAHWDNQLLLGTDDCLFRF